MKLLLIGDLCEDVYHYGHVNRISPEAPIPILDIVKYESRQGMSGNVYNNLVALGADVTFVHGPLSIKNRFVDIKTKQQLLRVDSDVISEPSNLPDNLNEYNGIVISDYNKGFVSYQTVDQIKRAYNGPIFIDTKKPELHRFKGCFVKINEEECNRASSLTDELIVTFGGKGVRYKQSFFEVEKVDVCDVTGAGDVFLASLAYHYIKCGDMDAAIRKAIHHASISVTHHGVYTLSPSDIDS